MCGIIGIVSQTEVNQALYDGLTVLQHRGQDAAGIVTCDNEGRFFLRKDNGMVKDVFHTRHMLKLNGNMGIGHVRYPTAGCSTSAKAQPFFVNSPFGITLAHNGNLTNTKVLKEELFQSDRRHLNTNSDSEVLLNVLALELQKTSKLKPQADDVLNCLHLIATHCRNTSLNLVHPHSIKHLGDLNLLLVTEDNPCCLLPIPEGSIINIDYLAQGAS